MSKLHSRDGQLLKNGSCIFLLLWKISWADINQCILSFAWMESFFLTAPEKEKILRLHLNRANPQLQEQPPQKQQRWCLWKSLIWLQRLGANSEYSHTVWGVQASKDEEGFTDYNSMINVFCSQLRIHIYLSLTACTTAVLLPILKYLLHLKVRLTQFLTPSSSVQSQSCLHFTLQAALCQNLNYI